MSKRIISILGSLILVIGSFACGVKGPPLPPVAGDPSSSDFLNRDRTEVIPNPSPTVSPSPSLRRKGQ